MEMWEYRFLFCFFRSTVLRQALLALLIMNSCFFRRICEELGKQ